MKIVGQCLMACIPVRSEPKSTSEIVTQLLYGHKYQVVSVQNDWMQILLDLDQYQGWISANQFSDVKFADSKVQLKYPFESFENIYVPVGSFLPVGSYEQIQSDDLIAEARKWLGVPYLWGGKTFMGVDCSGFVQVLFQVVKKIILPRDASQQAMVGEEVSWNNRQTEDLAFFKNEHGKITHVGIITEENEIIHASGKVREDKFDETGIKSQGKYTHYLAGIRRVTV